MIWSAPPGFQVAFQHGLPMWVGASDLTCERLSFSIPTMEILRVPTSQGCRRDRLVCGTLQRTPRGQCSPPSYKTLGQLRLKHCAQKGSQRTQPWGCHASRWSLEWHGILRWRIPVPWETKSHGTLGRMSVDTQENRARKWKRQCAELWEAFGRLWNFLLPKYCCFKS